MDTLEPLYLDYSDILSKEEYWHIIRNSKLNPNKYKPKAQILLSEIYRETIHMIFSDFTDYNDNFKIISNCVFSDIFVSENIGTVFKTMCIFLYNIQSNIDVDYYKEKMKLLVNENTENIFILFQKDFIYKMLNK